MTLLEKPAAAPRTWVMRDFHSPNIIWLGDRTGILRVGIIDFQDAVLGPAAYDLVSLLQDARIDVAEQLELTLLTRYIKARRAADGQFDPASFAELYAIMSAQRNTRLLGTFARLNRRDGKPQYLRHQPRIWTYLSRSLAHPALSAFREWYAANVPPPLPDLPPVSHPASNLEPAMPRQAWRSQFDTGRRPWRGRSGAREIGSYSSAALRRT